MDPEIKPGLIIGRNAVALVVSRGEDMPGSRVILIGPVEQVRKGQGAAVYKRGEALALAAALETLATELPIV